VLILQFMSDDGPGFLGRWLREQGVAADVFDAQRGALFPEQIKSYRALAVLGGAMSANDDLACLRHAERLILEAMRAEVPVLGHCLGGQLMARALGARVFNSPAPEVGWHRMDCVDSARSREWLGTAAAQTVFHWHYEAFELPVGAERLAASAACPNQAFAIGRHLAMQFHVEIDLQKIEAWLTLPGPAYAPAQARYATAHAPAIIRAGSLAHLSAQQALAGRIYARWLSLA
jgi:GMP synthase (glutamine-hydrolysing)